ncbi:MAG: Ldh family oxidoreductase [Candidatus Poribacteria bacterium]|nr:Ldh family oxidoreductase [Candidatus Poribacteria bacterium]
MPTYSADVLQTYATDIFVANCATRDEATTVAEVLVHANLTGHDSHGMIRVMQYCGAIRSGKIVPGAKTEILHETPTTAIFHAHSNFGPVSMMNAFRHAVERATEIGMFAYGIQDCNHIGRLGHYSELAAAKGFIPIISVNSTGSAARVAPFGGRQGRLGTNPISTAFPTDGDPVLVDMTSSIVAEGKVRVLRNKGLSAPDGWLLDGDGNPTNDPNAFYGPPPGWILPFGGPVGHKGFALSMMADLLCGTLTGAGNVNENPGPIGNGVFCLLMNVSAFRPEADYRAHASKFGAYVKDCPPAEGFSEVLLPGEPEARTRRQRLKSGIDVDETTWEQLKEEASRVNVSVPT